MECSPAAVRRGRGDEGGCEEDLKPFGGEEEEGRRHEEDDGERVAPRLGFADMQGRALEEEPEGLGVVLGEPEKTGLIVREASGEEDEKESRVGGEEEETSVSAHPPSERKEGGASSSLERKEHGAAGTDADLARDRYGSLGEEKAASGCTKRGEGEGGETEVDPVSGQEQEVEAHGREEEQRK